MLIYLAVPVLQNEKRTAPLIRGAAVVAVFAVTWFSFGALWPREYASFLANLEWWTLGHGDVGYSFFYVFGHITRKLATALELHALVSLLLIALVPLLFTKKYGRHAPFAPKLTLIYLVLTLANPRMKDYDLLPALAGFFAVLGLLLPRRAAPIILAGSLLAAVPVFVRHVAPDVFAGHPVLFDPFGTWRIIGLAVIAVLFLGGMMDDELPQTEKHALGLKPL